MEKVLCEQTTGIKENPHGIGQFYDCIGLEVSRKKARILFRQGEVIEVPNAGAGSFREVLKELGYKKVDVYEWGSSAGDWTFKIKGGFVSQENRYPRFGFRYGLCEVYE